MSHTVKKGLIAKTVLVSMYAPCLAFASTIDLPTTPLVSGTSVDPNLMLLVDSSYSMTAVVEQDYDGDDDNEGYDADTFSYTCDSANEYPYTKVYIKVKDGDDGTIKDGDVYFSNNTRNYIPTIGTKGTDGSTKFTFGNSGNTNEYCFDNDTEYTGFLNGIYEGRGTDLGYFTSSYFKGTFSGKFLNWYFSDDNFSDSGDSDATKNPLSSTRLEVAQEVVTELVTGLDDMRIGLAQFDEDAGANVLVDLDDIDDATQETALTTAITDNISMYLSTPLIEAVQDLGWYFSEDSDEELTLHYDDDDYEAVGCSAAEAFTPHDTSIIESSKTVVENWCQKNFLVVLTDGLPAGDTDFSDYMADYYDSSYYESSGDYTSYSSDISRLNVLRAIYETDLRPDLVDNDGDRNVNNVTSYMIGFSGTVAAGSTRLSNFATAGGGEYYGASDSDELYDALYDTTQNIYAETAAMSSVSIDSSSISSDTALFMASFSTSGWTGSFSAYEFDDSGSVNDDETWNAADMLDALSITSSSGDWDDIYDRNIFSYDEDSAKGVQFKYGKLSEAQQNDLKAGPDIDSDLSDKNKAKALINYLYGDTTYEGSSDTNYRERSSLLGDIVNSSSVYVGTPELSWPDYDDEDDIVFGGDDESYSDFQEEQANRTPIVYVGANDGMLHGFNADMDDSDSGQEVMAYIPGIIASTDDSKGMHYLADTDYAHEFYVDLTPTVSDVYVNTDDGHGKDWHSILVGGLRAGGKGIFALDVTDPDDFDDLSDKADDLVLWEFSSADDSDFGYSYSEPAVAMMQNGEWAVIVGNGYNNSGNGTAELFILFIKEGIDGEWDLDSNDYIKIDTEVGSTETPNGLTTPTVIDEDGDSVADYVYVGDLQGNMWKFDVSTSDEDDWDVAYKSGETPAPLFTATDSSGNAQAITSAPMVASYSSDFFVFFGTGKYLEESDLSDLSIMSYYAVRDKGVGEITRDSLEERSLYTNSGLRTISGEDIDWDTQTGWYFDLVDQASDSATTYAYGERVISESILSGDIVFFNSVIPDSSECSYGGDSWFMSVDLSTGLAPDYAIFDADEDGEIEDSSADEGGDSGYIGQSYSGGMVSSSTIVSDTQYSVDSTGTLVDREVNSEASSLEGRLSWEELRQSE